MMRSTTHMGTSTSTTRAPKAKPDPAAGRRLEFRYTPDGAKTRSWPFEPARMRNAEAEAIEDVTGWTFAQWRAQFFAGSMRATHALLWTYLRRGNAELKYEQVDFTDEETWFGLVEADGTPVPPGDVAAAAETAGDDDPAEPADGDAEGKAPNR